MDKEINIGITDANREKVAEGLSKLLADEYVLVTKTRNAHWNVGGIDFADKHKLFEDQYNKINEYIDDIAERVRMLGHYPPSKMSSFLKLSELDENLSGPNNSSAFIQVLLDDHETIIRYMRGLINPFNDQYDDAGNADFITMLVEEHEKLAWFLRAHVL
ncbi:DNA starvation/stationary phase protection protein [Marinifilum breve]|uniref:DNA starvation/stationary phase protection protein n=1 Tax=Marinifilum breve TaxID=2184082 RepID=A0A2V3ZYU8_9BACT|nr:DNA starvation/stationary phase protection protein [Marinifilum breve]PXY01825.1 DNA starvation/stationary phase protection protein [Marinifilum breve]